MSRYELSCQYCGHTRIIERKPTEKDVHCFICNDRYVRAEDLSSKIDYYAGSPPFPKEVGPMTETDHYNYFVNMMSGGD